MNDKTYEDGVREGKAVGRVDAIETIIQLHEDAISDQGKRLIIIERIIYGFAGALFLAQVLPALKRLLS